MQVSKVGWNPFDTTHTVTHPQLVSGFPADSDDWSCAQWESYFDALQNSFGQQQAVSIWNVDTDNTSTWSTVRNSCLYSCAWVNRMKGKGVEVNQGIFASAYCAVFGVTSAVQNVGEGATFATSLVKPAIIVAAIYAGYWGYNKFVKQ